MLRWKVVLAILAIVALLAVGATVGTAAAQKGGAVPSPSEERAAARERAAAAKKLLLLMDRDKDGRVSKQEWMSFMEAEFDRLDTDHDGYVNAKDLEQSQLRIAPVQFSKAGK